MFDLLRFAFFCTAVLSTMSLSCLKAETTWLPVSSKTELTDALSSDRFAVIAPAAGKVLAYTVGAPMPEHTSDVIVNADGSISGDLPDDAFIMTAQTGEFGMIALKWINGEYGLNNTATTSVIGKTPTNINPSYNYYPSICIGNKYVTFSNNQFRISATANQSAQLYRLQRDGNDPTDDISFIVDGVMVSDGDVIENGVGKTLEINVPDGSNVFYRDSDSESETPLPGLSLTFVRPGVYVFLVIDENENKTEYTLIVNGSTIVETLDFMNSAYGMTALSADQWQTDGDRSHSYSEENGISLFIPRNQQVALRRVGDIQFLEVGYGSGLCVGYQGKRITGLEIKGSYLNDLTVRRSTSVAGGSPSASDMLTEILFPEFTKVSDDGYSLSWKAADGANITGIMIVCSGEMPTRASGSARIESVVFKTDIPTNIHEVGNNDGKIRYYDLSGRQLPVAPTSCGLYIRVDGDKISKILVR